MTFTDENKNKLLSYYNKLIKGHKTDNSIAQGWASSDTEKTRFSIFANIGNLNNCSILDFGCGFGDLYNFLKNKKINFSYKGIDINPKMIQVAKEKNPNIDFETIDFGNYNPVKKFDYVFCSGALSFKIPNYKNFYFAYIKKMFEISKTGVAFNMLNANNNSTKTDEDLFAIYSISEVKDFCSKLTNKITIIENYLPNDFTFYLYH